MPRRGKEESRDGIFRWGPWLILVGGSLLAVGLALLVYRLEWSRETSHFNIFAHERLELIANRVPTIFRPVRHIASVMGFTGGQISAHNFQRLSESIPLSRHPALVALQWSTVVRDGAGRPTRLPVQHCFRPQDGEDACTSLSSPWALEALRRDRLVISPWYWADGQLRLRALRAVFSSERQGRLLGAVIGTYRVDRLIGIALAVGPGPVALYLRDGMERGPGIFCDFDGSIRAVKAGWSPPAALGPQVVQSIPLYGVPGYWMATWQGIAVAEPGLYGVNPWPPLVTALAGIALSALLAVYTHDLRTRERKVRDLVVERTRELFRRQQEFETLAEGHPDMIVRVDPQLRYRYVNEATARFFGHPTGAFVHQELGTLGLPATVAEEVKERARTALESGQSQTGEHVLETDAGIRYFEARYLPERWSRNGDQTLLIVARDITAQKQLQSELERMTVCDPLTGVANRRQLDQFVERGWRQEARHGHEVALILADIDHFKAYNDRYGHVRGDECLRRIAHALQDSLFRPGDMLVRYGGEEFAVVLPETALPAARQLAERLRQTVEALRMEHRSSPTADNVTLSLGVAAVKASESDFDALIAAADEALYRAKECGRNRVESAALQSGEGAR